MIDYPLPVGLGQTRVLENALLIGHLAKPIQIRLRRMTRPMAGRARRNRFAGRHFPGLRASPIECIDNPAESLYTISRPDLAALLLMALRHVPLPRVPNGASKPRWSGS
jgi:hypothetical protein